MVTEFGVNMPFRGSLRLRMDLKLTIQAVSLQYLAIQYYMPFG